MEIFVLGMVVSMAASFWLASMSRKAASEAGCLTNSFQSFPTATFRKFPGNFPVVAGFAKLFATVTP